MIEIEICKKIYDKAKETFLSKLEDEIKERKEEHIKQEKLEEYYVSIIEDISEIVADEWESENVIDYVTKYAPIEVGDNYSIFSKDMRNEFIKMFKKCIYEHDKELARGIGIPVAFVLGKYGKGLVPMALAESYLEKGQDIFEIFSLAEKGKMETDSGGKLEMFFVGVGLLAWLSVLNRDAEGAEKTLLSFRERARKDAPNLLPNIDAFLCRVHLYMGKDVADWMAQAPDESREFCTMDRFRYLTKVRIYIQRGQYQAAYCLIQQILYYAKLMKRTYIYMEATLLLAIVQYQMNQPAWKETLQECISRAEEYHFVRVLTREGPVLLQMLEKDKFIWQDAEYKNQVLTECRQMAEAYPSYLSEEGEEQIALSTNAVKILKLQAEGMASAAIAQRMKLSEATVKYHCRETYRKLGVKNKTAAIAEARKRKLI